MIDGLISGRLHGAPKSRSAANGSQFATGVLRTAMRDGSVVFASVIAFDKTAVERLLALADGAGVAIVGEFTLKVYQPPNGEPRPSLDVLAHEVLSPYAVQRKRTAARSDTNDPMDDAA